MQASISDIEDAMREMTEDGSEADNDDDEDDDDQVNRASKPLIAVQQCAFLASLDLRRRDILMRALLEYGPFVRRAYLTQATSSNDELRRFLAWAIGLEQDADRRALLRKKPTIRQWYSTQSVSTADGIHKFLKRAAEIEIANWSITADRQKDRADPQIVSQTPWAEREMMRKALLHLDPPAQEVWRQRIAADPGSLRKLREWASQVAPALGDDSDRESDDDA